jgi:hypothetical protein
MDHPINSEIQLGDRVKDTTTGFTGIAGAHALYRFGCAQFLVTPEKIKEDGSLLDSQWFDEQRIVLVDKLAKAPAPPSGGPQANAPRGRS